MSKCSQNLGITDYSLGWPMNLRDLLVSTSATLSLQACATTSGFLHVFWGSHVSVANTLSIEQSTHSSDFILSLCVLEPSTKPGSHQDL